MKIFIANIKEVDHPFRYIFFWFKQAFISFIPLKLKRQSRRYSFMARQYHMYYVLNICFNFTMILHGYKKKKRPMHYVAVLWGHQRGLKFL